MSKAEYRLIAVTALFTWVFAFATPARASMELSTALTPLQGPPANLRFPNSAGCALESKKPAPSVFLLIDGYDAGKVGNSVAKATGAATSENSAKAMRLYRLSIAELFQTIAEDLLQGRLPLLNGKTTDSVLKSLLDQAASEAPLPKTRAGDFIRTASKTDTASRCYYLKRFSALQAPLYQSKPDQALLTDIALASLEQQKLLTDCFDTDPALDDRNSILQFEVQSLDPREWEEKGFLFWASVKTYFAYAWAHQTEYLDVTHEFSFLFASIPVEESLFIVPNGCRSVSPPTCESESLNQNALRTLLELDGESDLMKVLPEGAGATVLKRANAPIDYPTELAKNSVEKDGNPATWLKAFRTRLSAHRVRSKNRVQSAALFLAAVSERTTITRILSALPNVLDAASLEDLYYLCSEFTVAEGKPFGILGEELRLTGDLETLDPLLATVTGGKRMKDFDTFYRGLSAPILERCGNLSKRKVWTNAKAYPPAGFQPWYKELLKNSDLSDPEMLPVAKPFLSMALSSTLGKVDNRVLCATGADCARKVLKSMLDLYAGAVYSENALNLERNIQSPALFSPYADTVACGGMDPNSGKRAAYRSLLVDLANTALFGWNPAPIWITAEFESKKLKSMDRKAKNGKIVYLPKTDSGKVDANIIADFGAFTGIPCSVAYSNSTPVSWGNTPYRYWYSGVEMRVCSTKEKNELKVGEGGDADTSPLRTNSFCTACTLNLSNIANVTSAVTGVPGIKLANSALFTVLHFLKNITDKERIPRVRVVDIAKTQQAYLRYGKIPKRCVRRLSKGKSCRGADKPATQATASFDGDEE